MKRFTETTKWRDPWFRRLSQTSKLLWIWLTDNCDNAGVIDIDLESASFDIGKTVNEEHLTEVESRLHALPNGKAWIPSFIEFQYGVRLSPKCVPHLRVLELLVKHGIQYPDDCDKSTTLLPTLVDTHKTRKGQDKDKEEGVQGETYHESASAVLHFLNNESGRSFRETDTNLTFVRGRLMEDGVTIEGVKMMISRQCKLWKSDPKMCEYLRPETLFNKTKFDAYYAARELPINSQTTVSNTRNTGVIVGPTVYGAHIKPRAQREREEAARLAGQVAKAEEQPLVDVEGSGGGSL